MDMQVPDVLMSVMTHGTVVTNLIPPYAAQAGLVTRAVDNASWLTQETVLVARESALTTVTATQEVIHTDATPPAIPAIPASKVTLDAAKTEPLNAEAASTQIQANSSNATKPIQIIHSAIHAQPAIPLTVSQDNKHATVALQSQISMHVTPRHLPARLPIHLELSNRPVTQVAVTSPQ
jgi:hypothetical protein